MTATLLASLCPAETTSCLVVVVVVVVLLLVAVVVVLLLPSEVSVPAPEEFLLRVYLLVPPTLAMLASRSSVAAATPP